MHRQRLGNVAWKKNDPQLFTIGFYQLRRIVMSIAARIRREPFHKQTA
jgi:hypothetical protein